MKQENDKRKTSMKQKKKKSDYNYDKVDRSIFSANNRYLSNFFFFIVIIELFDRFGIVPLSFVVDDKD